MKLTVAALLLSGFVFTGCDEDTNKNVGEEAVEIKVESVGWKEDLKKGIEWTIGDNSLNVANRMDILPANATNQKQTYSSSNTDVATVSEFGQVTAKALGTTTISVEVDGQSDDFVMTVVAEKEKEVVHVTGISIPDKNVSLMAGSTKNLATLFTVQPSNADDKSVTYVSGNTSVVTVTASGVITGVKEGTAKVSVTSNDVTSISEEFDITVTAFYGDYEPRNVWTVEIPHAVFTDGQNSITALFDNNFDTWLGIVKPGQTHNSVASAGYLQFIVDMKEAKTVNYFRVRHREQNANYRWRKFEVISGSNDGENYTVIATDVDIPHEPLTEIMTADVSIPESTFRYLKFYSEKAGESFTSSGKTVSMTEFYLGRAK